MFIGGTANVERGGTDALFGLAIILTSFMLTGMIVFLARKYLWPKDGFLEVYVYDDKLVFKYPKKGTEETFMKSDIEGVDIRSEYGGFSMYTSLGQPMGVSSIGVYKKGVSRTFDTGWSGKMASSVQSVLTRRGYNILSTHGTLYGGTTSKIEAATGEVTDTTGTGLYSPLKPKHAWVYFILAPIFLLLPSISAYTKLYLQSSSLFNSLAYILGFIGVAFVVRLIAGFSKNRKQKTILSVVFAFISIGLLFGGPLLVDQIYLNQNCSEYRMVKEYRGEGYIRLCRDRQTGEVKRINM